MQRSVSARWHDQLDQRGVERRGRFAAPPAFGAWNWWLEGDVWVRG
jgi:hypothetical protein